MSTQGFANSVPVLILPIFRRLLLRNSKFTVNQVNVCFQTSKHSVQTADDNNKLTTKAF